MKGISYPQIPPTISRSHTQQDQQENMKPDPGSTSTTIPPHHDLEGLRQQILANAVVTFSRIYQKTPACEKYIAQRHDFEVIVEVDGPGDDPPAADTYRALLVYRKCGGHKQTTR
ncbi:hypothetical protein CLAFUW4_09452 [Fulvia fulva]|uniref:Uncharacterized protein n=1 Tax=Passalora fulva TaxID=5499 RepID=A0A9Q8PH00_PASFU|nr:uncharacterized protein CLAFUR5_09549 [Fulvia fulva]KAK4614060.1 hypothetical protein CLAFUR4_09458 [Fulvia fulva]UJO22246.1 hypothetical protein CLAFUR5_09549 [Fulvia fulva]WPV20354.1 hypothetical protein CLAFUW4_09452 [Fulvia fulva]WPV35076.1 hypothetical protein CLAFUW7_09453 [Fulvia fulva]